MLQSPKLIPKFLSIALLATSFIGMTAGTVQAQSDVENRREAAVEARVNINEADAETIAEILSGVGQSRAQAIVEYRELHGPFTTVEELIEVRGVGEATLRLNKEKIVLK
jgi:competence protein ComEA